MKHRSWLDITEYVMLFGSGVGTVASVALQQVIYTAAPLSFLMLLNLVNRQRLQRRFEQELVPVVSQLDQRLSDEVEALSERVAELPDVSTLSHLKTILLQHNQRAILQLANRISRLQKEVTQQTASLQENDLSLIRQDMEKLQERSRNLEASFKEVTAYLNQVASAIRVDALEGVSAKLSADFAYLKTEVTQVQTSLKSFTDEQRGINPRSLQDQIDHLNRRVSNLPQPFDASSLKKDIDSLLNVVTDLVSRRELSRLLAEFEKLHQQHHSFEQSVTVVRLASSVFRKQLETLSNRLSAREETLNWLTGEVTFQAESPLSDEVKRSLANLADGLTALQERFNHLAVAPDPDRLRSELEQVVNSQMATVQHQLATVQQATQTLEQEQTTLRDLLDRLPETSDRALETQLNSLATRVDWAEQRVELAETSLNTLQAQVETTAQKRLAEIAHSWQTVPPTLEVSAEILADFAADLRLPETSATVIEQLNNLATRVEWAENNLATLQVQVEEMIQPQLAEISQQVQGFAPELATVWDSSAVTEVLSEPEPEFEPLPPNPRYEIEHEVLAPIEPLAIAPQTYQTSEPPIALEPAFHFDSAMLESPFSSDNTEATPMSSRAMLEDALDRVQQRIIIVSPYPTPETIDNQLIQKLESVLQRGVSIDIGWGHLADISKIRLPRCLHQPAIDANEQGFLHTMLRQLSHLKQRFSSQFHFKILGTHENFLVCDRAFAILGVHPIPTASEIFSVPIGLSSRDPDVVQSLIERFDAPDPDPQNSIAYFNRGTTRHDLGDKQGAIKDYTRVLHLSPQDDIAYNNRGLARYELGDRSGAIIDFNNTLQLNPHSAITYFNRGCARADLGDKLGSVADYSQAIELKPNFATAYFCRGIARTRMGNRSGAIEDYSEAIHLDPQDAMSYFYRGVAYFRRSDKTKAAADLRQAEKLFAQQKDKTNRHRVREAIKELEEALVEASNDLEPQKYWTL